MNPESIFCHGFWSKTHAKDSSSNKPPVRRATDSIEDGHGVVEGVLADKNLGIYQNFNTAGNAFFSKLHYICKQLQTL